MKASRDAPGPSRDHSLLLASFFFLLFLWWVDPLLLGCDRPKKRPAPRLELVSWSEKRVQGSNHLRGGRSQSDACCVTLISENLFGPALLGELRGVLTSSSPKNVQRLKKIFKFRDYVVYYLIGVIFYYRKIKKIMDV